MSRAFDAMRGALAARLAELEAANRELGERQTRLSALQAELIQRERAALSGRLVAELAHEIRNPVASLRNCLELIRRRMADDPQGRRFADLAIDELLRMHELAERMLDLNRPRDAGAAVCDAAAVARESAALFALGRGEVDVHVHADGDAAGNLVSVAGTPISGGRFDTGRDLRGATAIIITIEPAGDTDAVPAATKMMAGDVTGGTATLTVGAPQALGNTFSSASGRYILATPTDGMGNNERSGIWFIDPSSGSPMPGLSLPVLPPGWRYEGWSVISGTPVTTGRFTAVNAADAAAPFSGPMPGPPFPGEDFLANAPAGLTFPTDLRGTSAVITIEPEPDDGPAPFTLKPLAGMVPADAVDRTPYTMANQAATNFPTGTARIRD